MSDQRQRAIAAALAELSGELIEVSHEIHGRPELGGEERWASALLAGRAEAAGFEVERGPAGLETAFVARFRLGNGEGPRIALLAEYDALPELGHACGHNWIAATSLGAALGLARGGAGLVGEVLLMGTPAEETVGGKVLMLERGVFDEVDLAMMIHPSRRTAVDRSSQANCPIEIEFRGQSAHAAASPEAGRNALDAAVLTQIAVDQLHRHLRADARTPRILSHGGDAPNVIPDRAVLRFTLRAADARYVEFLRQRVEDCARGAAIATHTEWSARLYASQYLELISNPPLVRLFRQQLERLGFGEGRPSAGGALDIGNVSHRLPVIHPDLEVAPADAAGHTEAFCRAAASPRADAMISVGAELLATTALSLLLRPELLEEARSYCRGGCEGGDGGGVPSPNRSL